MSGAMVGAAAITAVAGGVEANQNSKKAEGLMNQQMGLQQQNVNSVQQFQQGQQQTYGPLEQQLVQQASSDQPLFFGAMKGAVNQNFDQGQRNLQTQMAQRGMAGSGLAAGGATGMELGRSGALDTAFQQGLQSRLQLGQSVLSRYQPMLNQSMLSQAYQGQSGVAGQQGQMYNQAAQQGWNQVGSALGSAATGAMLGGLQQPTGTPALNSVLANGAQQLPVQAPTMAPDIAQPMPLISGQGNMMGTGTVNPQTFSQDFSGMGLQGMPSPTNMVFGNGGIT